MSPKRLALEQPSRSELVGGLAVLLILAGIVISRDGQTKLADALPSSIGGPSAAVAAEPDGLQPRLANDQPPPVHVAVSSDQAGTLK